MNKLITLVLSLFFVASVAISANAENWSHPSKGQVIKYARAQVGPRFTVVKDVFMAYGAVEYNGSVKIAVLFKVKDSDKNVNSDYYLITLRYYDNGGGRWQPSINSSWESFTSDPKETTQHNENWFKKKVADTSFTKIKFE